MPLLWCVMCDSTPPELCSSGCSAIPRCKLPMPLLCCLSSARLPAVPFPAIKDQQVIAKMRYNEYFAKHPRRLLTGEGWLHQQAFRCENSGRNLVETFVSPC